MKRLFILAAALAACTSTPTDPGTAPKGPTAGQVQAACNADMLIRPSVNALLPLAAPKDTAIVMAAQKVVDGICASVANAAPGTPVEQQTLQSVTAAAAQILGVYVALEQARKAGKAASAPG